MVSTLQRAKRDASLFKPGSNGKQPPPYIFPSLFLIGPEHQIKCLQVESPLSPHNSSAPASLSQGVAKALQGLHLEDQDGLLIEEVAQVLLVFLLHLNLLQVEGPGSPGSPQTFGRESVPTSPPQSPHSFLITPGFPISSKKQSLI